jgi:two-component system response regulator RpaA
MEKYDVILAEDGSEGLKLAIAHQPRAILLDVLMQTMDGLSACEAIRRDPRTENIPVLMLTAVSGLNEKVRAFRAGADDYIGKPFYPEELLARLESKLRRVGRREDAASPVIQCGNLTLNLEAMEVRVDGKEIALTLLEFNLLKFFIENTGKLKSRDEILGAVWKNKDTPSRILDPHILAIRRKLEGFDHRLSTIYGGGYILKKEA